MSTNNIKIFDDFLTQEENKKIFDEMISMSFPWGYSRSKVYDRPNHPSISELEINNWFICFSLDMVEFHHKLKW